MKILYIIHIWYQDETYVKTVRTSSTREMLRTIKPVFGNETDKDLTYRITTELL